MPVNLDNISVRSTGQGTDALKVYLPSEALQGESLPSFAIWHDHAFKAIEVTFSSALRVDELYNVAPGDCDSEPGKLTVRKIEVEGYLGILFGSQRLQTTSEQAQVVFHFHHPDGAVQSITRAVHLFHPLLAVREIPKTIRVDLANRTIKESVQVRNVGEGTVILSIKSDEDSDVRIEQPQAISEFNRLFRQDVTTGLAELEETFPRQSGLLEELAKLLGDEIPLGDQASMQEYEKVAQDFRKAVSDERDFGKRVVETISAALLKNLHLFNIFEQLVDYFHSVRAKKVILRNPLDVIKVDTKPASLKIKLQYTDLTNNYYQPVSIDSMIVANAPGDFPIYMLLGWGD